MINNNNVNDNITNDVPVAGTDLFADSEDFLNELTDSDLGQIVGGADFPPSDISILLCGGDELHRITIPV